MDKPPLSKSLRVQNPVLPFTKDKLPTIESGAVPRGRNNSIDELLLPLSSDMPEIEPHQISNPSDAYSDALFIPLRPEQHKNRGGLSATRQGKTVRQGVNGQEIRSDFSTALNHNMDGEMSKTFPKPLNKGSNRFPQSHGLSLILHRPSMDIRTIGKQSKRKKGRPLQAGRSTSKSSEYAPPHVEEARMNRFPTAVVQGAEIHPSDPPGPMPVPPPQGSLPRSNLDVRLTNLSAPVPAPTQETEPKTTANFLKKALIPMRMYQTRSCRCSNGNAARVDSAPPQSIKVRNCLACGKDVSTHTKVRGGPDGPGTLCSVCYKLHSAKKLPLYRDEKTGRVSADARIGATKLRVIGFPKTDRGRDLLHPEVVPAHGDTFALGDGAFPDHGDGENEPITDPGMETTRCFAPQVREDHKSAVQRTGSNVGIVCKQDSHIVHSQAFSVKIKCMGYPFRRYKIQEGLTFKEFEEEVQDIFRLSQKFEMSYKDNEGDAITLSSEREMEELFDILRCTALNEEKSFNPSTHLTPLRIEVAIL